MECPKCGGGLYIEEKQNYGSKIIRMRKCMECGTPVFTMESKIDDKLGTKIMQGGGTSKC